MQSWSAGASRGPWRSPQTPASQRDFQLCKAKRLNSRGASGRPAASHAHCLATGQSSQRGAAAVQVSAPSSMTATDQRAAMASSSGSSDSANRYSAAEGCVVEAQLMPLKLRVFLAFALLWREGASHVVLLAWTLATAGVGVYQLVYWGLRP